MRDPETGLYYHGYDASRKVFWADPETGLSRNFWLRADGWFACALADLTEIIPADRPEHQEIAGMLGISENGSTIILAKARKQLKEKITRYLKEQNK